MGGGVILLVAFSVYLLSQKYQLANLGQSFSVGARFIAPDATEANQNPANQDAINQDGGYQGLMNQTPAAVLGETDQSNYGTDALQCVSTVCQNQFIQIKGNLGTLGEIIQKDGKFYLSKRIIENGNIKRHTIRKINLDSGSVDSRIIQDESIDSEDLRHNLTIRNLTIDGDLIVPNYFGQTSITTLGTIISGTWQGSLINSNYLGTNVMLEGENISLLTNNAGYITAASSDTLTNKTWNGNIVGLVYGGTGTATGSITGTGALNFSAGGTNQNVTLTPSGSGYTILNGNVGIGTTAPGAKLEVVGSVIFGDVVTGSALRYDPITNTIVNGAHENSIGTGAFNSIIAGGGATASSNINTIGTGSYVSTISGGYDNVIGNSAEAATIGGGGHHLIADGGTHGTIAGGSTNTITADGDYGSISGGLNNTVSNTYAHIGGGNNNTASGYRSAVLGGSYNTASNDYAVVLGGLTSSATGTYSASWGRRAIASGSGALVLADSTNADYTGSTDDTFSARFAGGYDFTGGTFRADTIKAGSSTDGASLGYTTGIGKVTGIDKGGNGFNTLAFYTSSTAAITILTSGNVGIGTTNPTALLHLNGTAGKVSLEINSNEATAGSNIFMLRSDVTTGDSAKFRVQADGLVFAGTYSGLGADYAEYFYTDNTDLASGEAVCVDITKANAVKRCERTGDNNIMGIVSTNPSIVGNNSEKRENDPHYKVIGMLGQVPAKVSNENGEIQIGDSLTSANTPGYLRKANAGESTVGVAMQNSNETKTTIQVLISRRNQSLTVEKVEETVTQNIAKMNIEDQITKMLTTAQSKIDNAESQNFVSLREQVNKQNADFNILQKQMDDLELEARPIVDFYLALGLKNLIYKDTLGNLNLLDGKITAKDIEALNTIKAKDIEATDSIKGDTLELGKDTTGKNILKAGETKVEIETALANKDAKIYITPVGNTFGQVLYVDEISDGKSFKVKINEKQDDAINFNWLIVK